jgi:hypothetical protein
MQPRLVFLVMSAVSKAETVDQLARSLAPHPVLVHHDFSQTPEFPLTAPNVRFVPEPRRTGWAFFGFVEGIFHSLRYALAHLDFDYLQLLSPTCLPIAPLAHLEACVAGGAQAHFDCVDLLADRDALMSVGYRAFTPQDSFRHRLTRRATDLYFARSAGRRDEAGIWLHSGGGRGPLGWPAALLISALRRPSIGRHPFDENFHPYYGSAWFGARREIVEGMVRIFGQPRVHDYFSRLCIAEEFLIPTILMQLVTTKGPMHHVIKTYNGARVGWFDENDLPLLRESGAFFARKFPDDPDATIRLRVLNELVAGSGWRDPARIATRQHPGAHAPPQAANEGAHVHQVPSFARGGGAVQP